MNKNHKMYHFYMSILDVIFPKFCLGCGFLGQYLCQNCQKKLKYLNKDTCLYCEKNSYFGLTHPKCLKKNRLDGSLSLFYYNEFFKKIVKNIKYRLALDVWEELKKIIPPDRTEKINLFKKLKKDFFIQPIPLHKERLKERGFNQAQLIADYFNHYLNLPTIDALVRKKSTVSQAQTKTKQLRYGNLMGAFVVKTPVKNKNIILIDDVITSGATVKEATRALKKAGAQQVFCLTLAKG